MKSIKINATQSWCICWACATFIEYIRIERICMCLLFARLQLLFVFCVCRQPFCEWISFTLKTILRFQMEWLTKTFTKLMQDWDRKWEYEWQPQIKCKAHIMIFFISNILSYVRSAHQVWSNNMWWTSSELHHFSLF